MCAVHRAGSANHSDDAAASTRNALDSQQSRTMVSGSPSAFWKNDWVGCWHMLVHLCSRSPSAVVLQCTSLHSEALVRTCPRSLTTQDICTATQSDAAA